MKQKIFFALLSFLYNATCIIAMNNQGPIPAGYFMHKIQYSRYEYLIPNTLKNDLILNNIKFNRKTGKAYINPDLKEFFTCSSVFHDLLDKMQIPWGTKKISHDKNFLVRTTSLKNENTIAEMNNFLTKIITISKAK